METFLDDSFILWFYFMGLMLILVLGGIFEWFMECRYQRRSRLTMGQFYGRRPWGE